VTRRRMSLHGTIPDLAAVGYLRGWDKRRQAIAQAVNKAGRTR
jgi:hypothetical protein